jgi:hypothetical protein
MTDAEASAAFPWLQDYWSTFGPFFARPPGGESLAQVCERVYAFLQKVARTMAGKRVLVVSHAGTMWWHIPQHPTQSLSDSVVMVAAHTDAREEHLLGEFRTVGLVSWRFVCLDQAVWGVMRVEATKQDPVSTMCRHFGTGHAFGDVPYAQVHRGLGLESPRPIVVDAEQEAIDSWQWNNRAPRPFPPASRVPGDGMYRRGLPRP